MKKILLAILMVLPMTIMAQSKFAHYNYADILPNMKEYAAAQTELQSMEKQYMDDLKLMQDELQKKAEDYQKEAANLLDNVRARREQELNDLAQRFQQTQQDSQLALQKASQEKMALIVEKVMAAVKKIGEAGGYVYIVDISSGAISFVNSALSTDITAQLKKELGIVATAATATPAAPAN
ncbi:MAG: OmpH family outer membrane protein [Bacteroidaceae bacterium]|nr:OmpH family outer membrane protein [Bacteroidaceae bacterium]